MINKNQKKKISAISRTIFDNYEKDENNKELLDKMKDKKLP